jgi:hypothetical protein
MRKQLVCGAAIASMLLINLPARASAQTSAEVRKLTYLTFSAPVQLPGFSLPAGTYRLSLADPDTTRRVVEVASQDGKKTYGMLLTIPDERAKPAKDPIVLFNETPAGTPEAVRTWFYPGETIGYELVYPKNQALDIAKKTHQGVLTTEGDVSTTGGDRVKTLHGAKVGRIDENGHFSAADEPTATSGTTTTTSRPASTTDKDKDKDKKDKDKDRK